MDDRLRLPNIKIILSKVEASINIKGNTCRAEVYNLFQFFLKWGATFFFTLHARKNWNRKLDTKTHPNYWMSWLISTASLTSRPISVIKLQKR